MPLGGGGCHGGQWHEGKLWLVANRMNALIRVDPKTWTPEFGIPIYTGTPETLRWHDMTFDGQGNLWLITGNDSTNPESGRAGLARYDMTSGKCVEYVTFAPDSADPHGLGFHDGKLISTDAGHHPGWADQASKDAGWVFTIEIS
jgi:streptogramin lyase